MEESSIEKCNVLTQFVLITNFTHFFNMFISLLYMFRAWAG